MTNSLVGRPEHGERVHCPCLQRIGQATAGASGGRHDTRPGRGGGDRGARQGEARQEPAVGEAPARRLLEYLARRETFWKTAHPQLQTWEAAIRAGERPRLDALTSAP